MANYNKNFGTVKEEGKLQYSPNPLIIDGEKHWTNIKERYLSQGYYPVVYTEEPEKEGYYYQSYFELENEAIVQKWKEYEIAETIETATNEEIQNAIREGVNSVDS